MPQQFHAITGIFKHRIKDTGFIMTGVVPGNLYLASRRVGIRHELVTFNIWSSFQRHRITPCAAGLQARHNHPGKAVGTVVIDR